MKKISGALILVGLVIVVVVLTVGEKYIEHERVADAEVAAASARTDWEIRLNRMFDARWRDLSTQTRAVLDSLVTETLHAGVSAESLLVVIEALTSEAAAQKKAAEPKPESPTQVADVPQDNPVDTIMIAYRSALDALPGDLSSYEKRIAVDEVRYLIRVRFNLSEAKMDSLLTSRDS